jgi:hypothetical protein
MQPPSLIGPKLSTMGPVCFVNYVPGLDRVFTLDFRSWAKLGRSFGAMAILAAVELDLRFPAAAILPAPEIRAAK